MDLKDELRSKVSGAGNSVKVNPYLRTALYTPSVSTGKEDSVYDANGFIDLTRKRPTTEQKPMGMMLSSGYIPDGWGMPLCLMGDPGCGKTTSVKEASEALGLTCVTSISSTKDPTDFNGIPITTQDKLHDPNGKVKTYKGGEVVYAWGTEPVYDEDLNPVKALFRQKNKPFTAMRGEPIHCRDGSLKRKKKVVWVADTAVPRLYVELAKLGVGTLFLDELTTAAPAVQAALLRLTLDKKVGEFALPPGIRIIAAANSVDTAANGSDISLPLANRFGWLPWARPTFKAWSEFMLSSGNEVRMEPINAVQEQNRVLSLWGNASAQAKGKICGFLQKINGTLLFAMPDRNSKDASLAYPTPRSWHMATSLLASAMIQGLEEPQQSSLISAVVGTAAASQLFTYLRDFDLPDPVAVLDEKEVFIHNPKRLDRSYAAFTSMVALMLAPVDKNDPKALETHSRRLTRLWQILTEVHKVSAEVIAMPAIILVRNKMFYPGVALELLYKLGTMMSEAGVSFK